MKWGRLWAVMLKELRQMRRDRVTLAMIVGVPVLQLLLFGYAINMNVRGLQAGIADQAGSAGSRALVMDMLATGVAKATLVARTPQESSMPHWPACTLHSVMPSGPSIASTISTRLMSAASRASL